MSSVWGKFKKIFTTASPPKQQSNGETNDIDFDKYYYPEIIGESHILSKDEIEFVDRNLPQRMVGVKWILKYSTETDGYSLATLYRKLRDWDHPVLLVIEDDFRHRFGAFGTESFRPDYKVRGNFECFVFRLMHIEFRKQHEEENNGDAAQSIDANGGSHHSSQDSISTAASAFGALELENISKPEDCQGNSNNGSLETNGRVNSNGDTNGTEDISKPEDCRENSNNGSPETNGRANSNGDTNGTENISKPEDCRENSNNGSLETNGHANSNFDANGIGDHEDGSDDEVNGHPSEPTAGCSAANNGTDDFDFSQNKVWTWTSLPNSVFIHGEIPWLRIGLHDGATALWVDEDLRFGGSDCCKIFNNERLAPNPKKASSDHTFKIIKVEVWGFKQ